MCQSKISEAPTSCIRIAVRAVVACGFTGFGVSYNSRLHFVRTHDKHLNQFDTIRRTVESYQQQLLSTFSRKIKFVFPGHFA